LTINGHLCIFLIFQNGSSDYEKVYAANEFLNQIYFKSIIVNDVNAFKNTYIDPKKRAHIYKYRAVFDGKYILKKMTSFSQAHSILAYIVLDNTYIKTENEHPIITKLKENYKDIIRFSKDDSQEKLLLKSYEDIRYRTPYKELLKHIMVSDKDFPSNIAKDSLTRITDDYIILKK